MYVEKYFKPQAKERMDQLIKNLRVAFEQAINDLEWMSAETKVAAQEKVALFDLNAQSCADIRRFGIAASQAYFIQVPAGLYQKFPEGKTDNTHLTTQGASWIAQLFVRELKKQQHPLAAFVWRELL